MIKNEEIGKFYDFKEEHNPRTPVDYWFQNPKEGFTLFLVFYTQACRWARCLGCNLPSQTSEHPVSYKNIMQQIDYVFDYILTKEEKLKLRKFIISNNGSILDEKTYSTTSLMYFLAKMNLHCPNISVLTIETRPEYVDLEELEVLSRALKEGNTPTQLEIAIGFEAYDETIRNDYFRKGLTLEIFEKMAEKISRYGFKIKTYFMLKPVPEISEEDAILDIKNSINYLHMIANKYSLEINIHLNPTYVARGTALEEEFRKGNFTPPKLESVREAALEAEGKNISLFIGLNDEGLAVEGGSFIKEGEEDIIKAMEKFNQTQNFSYLKY
ncbi:MAG: hypothetical protein KAX49_04390 [Halanaerobiales bacterium]|nr:hypothetical protein [Halanaerobiales bacterium]